MEDFFIIPRDIPVVLYNMHYSYSGSHKNGIPEGYGVGKSKEKNSKTLKGIWKKGQILNKGELSFIYKGSIAVYKG